MTVQELEGAGRRGAGVTTAHYVYGVVASSSASTVRAEGIGGARVEALPFRKVTALVSEAEADTENNTEKTKARYKADSAHIKAYYRTNQYPS